MTLNIEVTRPLALWRVNIRHLGCSSRDRGSFNWYVAVESDIDERAAAEAMKQKHAPEWWKDYLITEVQFVGRLHVIKGQQIQEED